jgi:excisionase family DNA binding protein
MRTPSALDEPSSRPQLLTVRQASEILGVSTSFLYDAIARGEIAAVRIGRLIRLHPDALLGQGGSDG